MLEEESNLHGEIGYRVEGERLSGSLVVYVDRFDDYIYQQNTGAEQDGLPVRLWAQQDADFVGAELELRYDIGHYESGHWWVFGLFDYVDGELDDGHNVPLMPPMRIGGGLDWHLGAWQANLTWIHADDHTDVAEYETPTPAYDLLGTARPCGAGWGWPSCRRRMSWWSRPATWNCSRDRSSIPTAIP